MISVLVSAGLHFGFGVGLFLSVAKFFDFVEDKLDQNTKDDVAKWLLDLQPSKKIGDWRQTFPKMLDQIFGRKHLSWKCFWRSCFATAFVTLTVMLGRSLLPPRPRDVSEEAFYFVFLFITGTASSVLPDYVSLGKTRYLINLSHRMTNTWFDFLLLAIDVSITIGLTLCAAFVASVSLELLMFRGAVNISYAASHFFYELQVPIGFAGLATVWFIPAFFGRVWLLLYVGCGLLLKVSRRLDIGVTWFNEKFDILYHPLQCIGLVAGIVSALGYWLLALIHLVPRRKTDSRQAVIPLLLPDSTFNRVRAKKSPPDRNRAGGTQTILLRGKSGQENNSI